MNMPMKILLASDIILNLYLWCMTEPFRSRLWQGYSKTAICLWSVTVSVANSSAGLCRRGWHLKTATGIFIREWRHCNYFGVELRFVKGQLKYVVKRQYPTAMGLEVKEIVRDSLIAAVASIENPHGYPEKYDFEDIQNLGDIISGNKSRLDEKTKHKSVKVALELQGTNLFDALVSRFPDAQLKVLEALEKIREDTKNNNSSNINYRKFIRDC
jgi:hypothetical protein